MPRPPAACGVPAEQLAILSTLGLPIRSGEAAANEHDLVIDAVLGYGQAGAPAGAAARLMRAAAGRRVLSLDVPSGLELATGTLHESSVAAEVTLTLAAPKAALRGRAAVGRLFLADISVPPWVWGRIGVAPPAVFGRAPVVEVAGGS